MKRAGIFAAFLVVGAAVLVTAPVSAQVYVAGPGLGLAVPDNTYVGTGAQGTGGMLCSTGTVPPGGGGGDIVDNVTLEVRLTHSWVGDLTIKLVGPTLVVATVVSRPGEPEVGDNGTEVGPGDSSNILAANPLTYDQVAVPESETMGSVPALTGDQTICVDGGSPCNYNPDNGSATSSEDLSTAFDGTTKVGNWQLCIGDSVGADLGTLDGWTLTVTATPVELQEFTIE